MESQSLKKALHKAISKAYQSGKTAREHSVRHAVSDIEDSNSAPQLPAKDIPVAAQSVLHKDVTVSEVHQQKQANAMAKLGQPPQAPRLGAQPKPVSTPPQMGAPKAPQMGGASKAGRPLSGFMAKKESKRSGLETCSHCGMAKKERFSSEEARKVFDKYQAIGQAKEEAYLRSPEGEARRQKENRERQESQKDSKKAGKI